MEEIMNAIDKGYCLTGFSFEDPDKVLGPPKLDETPQEIHPDLFPEAKITTAHASHVCPGKVKGDEAKARVVVAEISAERDKVRKIIGSVIDAYLRHAANVVGLRGPYGVTI